MERKDFLKNACTYGLCGCVGMSFITGNLVIAGSKSAQDEEKSDWRVDFMQNRYKDLIYILNETIDEETFSKVLNKLGAKCGEDFANKYKNDPEGFFTFIKSLWADTVDYDKENGIIKVNERIRDTCNCPFIRAKEAPSILCNCSLGTQKKIYESLFGRPVNVILEKSVLRGDERCCFTIQLL
jgi:predicted ArsR family transcriptional regulator